MDYTNITISVPSGYEDQITALVTERIKNIISYELTKPTQEQQDAIAAEIDNASTLMATAQTATLNKITP